ncbi:phosphatidylglycerol / phosphatidylinositol transfer protein [Beauveria brongniartii RCEF 3172]|uniref:Phosphatidylglycerol/phosphatidylinositol transfer protein n=1 Tax=Beauveria brongniartii RCEF 3172 TaxID=1081107 RepID=A0A167CEQ0_9HYPO|nr:phosphatidylglycerol / phosphatidylinositol transfer protein [Beauveria brongniartii RCEF 3172]
MKFSSALGLLSLCLAPALSAKIPGDSPLELCDGDHSDDLITINNVDLTPNPPKAGQDLLIEASGTVKETIEQGAYVKLTVKYGLITLLTTNADLCEQIGNVDLKCPVTAGDQTIEKIVKLPVEIPPGKYTVRADVYNADDTPITCLTATVTFAIGGMGFFNEL